MAIKRKNAKAPGDQTIMATTRKRLEAFYGYHNQQLLAFIEKNIERFRHRPVVSVLQNDFKYTDEPKILSSEGGEIKAAFRDGHGSRRQLADSRRLSALPSFDPAEPPTPPPTALPIRAHGTTPLEPPFKKRIEKKFKFI